MATTVLSFFLVAVAVGTSGNAITVAHNVTVAIKCTVTTIPPYWFVNGNAVRADGDSYRSIISASEATTTLMIDGNRTSDPLNMVCIGLIGGQLLPIHNTTLTFQVKLHPPENIRIINSTIEWNSPYFAMNNGTIHVHPHIIHYTVHITDMYTGNIIKRNVTKTRFTSDIQDDLCPMYQVSVWNAGGEGEMSEPVQENAPRVPRSIVAENITIAVEPDTLGILIYVDVVCVSRIPEFFLVTLMTSAGSVLNETRQHQPGQPIANFTISLPLSVDMCTLHMRICAGNSAGMSAPSNTIEIDCPGGSSESTTTTVTAFSAANTGTGNGSRGNEQQGENTTLIVILIGVIAAMGGVCIVAATVGIIYCRGHKKDKLKKREIEMKPNQAYEIVTLPSSSRCKTQVHTKPCPAYEVVVQAHH